MKRLLKVIFGFNAISLRHLLRLRFVRFFNACENAFSASRFTNSDLRDNPRIPEMTLGDILAERKPVIRLSVSRYEDGQLPTVDALVLLSILVAEAPGEILEIGTFMGSTSRQMAENLPGGFIHTVDLPEGFSANSNSEARLPKDDFHLIGQRMVGREFKESEFAPRIRQHFFDTAEWDFSEARKARFFFIDGSHTYEYCKNDSEKCFALCRGQGVFLWHDCDSSHPGVERFICEWRRLGRDIKRIKGSSIAYWKGP